eukprot:m.13517 g.13517  ORF g.13517 m.13517 type:complete len:57 (-) comp2834_c0_seq1:848-1018(-)
MQVMLLVETRLLLSCSLLAVMAGHDGGNQIRLQRLLLSGSLLAAMAGCDGGDKIRL